MSEPGLRARQPKAIQNALAVLEAVAHAGPGITAQQVSSALGMPRATTYRLITLLVEDEYLVRLPDLRGFALGHKVAELAGVTGPASTPAPLPRAVRAVLAETRASVRAGVHLARYDQGGIRDVDVDPDFPLLDAAALWREPERSAMGRLRSVGGDGPVRQVGAYASGFGCLALPVRAEDGSLVAGLTLSAPAARVTAPGDALSVLRAAVVRLEPLLG